MSHLMRLFPAEIRACEDPRGPILQWLCGWVECSRAKERSTAASSRSSVRRTKDAPKPAQPQVRDR
jgi:hypothetical protein